MSQRPKQPDDLSEMLSRLEREFQQRPSAPPLEQPTDRQPVTGTAVPVPPRQQRGIALPTSQPRLVYALLAINVVMYAVTLLVQQRVRLPLADPLSPSNIGDTYTLALYVLGAKWGPAIAGGEYWRLLMPMVLHGGLIHLGFNSYALYVLGPQIERIYGAWRFLAIYLLAGLAGNALSFVVAPYSLAIGASGAIFGLIGALGAWSYSARALIGAQVAQRQLQQVATMAIINLFIGFTLPNIDNSAHIGGLIAGGLVGFVLAPRYAVDQQLYPPVVVVDRRGAQGWLLSGAVFIAILAIAAFGIMRLS